jgi:hypothetical protein
MCGPTEAPEALSDAASGTGGSSSTTMTWPATTSSTGGSAPLDPCETGAGCPPGPAPAAQPCPGWPGWETWDDFAPVCPLCVPASPDALPEPIAWEPCDPKAHLAAGCRQMAVSWPWYSTAFAYTVSVDIRPDGSAVLDLTRIARGGSQYWRMNVVAEADGAALGAILDPRTAEQINSVGCTYQVQTILGMGQGKRVVQVIQGKNDGEHDVPEGVLGGAITELHPKAQWAWQKSRGHAFAASDLLWATSNGYLVGVAAWGEPWQVVFSGADVGGQNQNWAAPWHDLVTWQSNSGVYSGIMAWTAERGAYPFVMFPGDWSRGAECLGTDGVHMVWTYGEGKGPGEEPYPVSSVMVSPFTKDAAQLAPVRLRSYPTLLHGIAPWAVGCGFAAHELEFDRILVVRLSDGWSWILTTEDEPDAGPIDEWGFSTVYAVSCEELFLRAGVGVQMNVARVRLDALGPGMPPD